MPEFVLNIGDRDAWGRLDEFTRGYIEAAFFSTSIDERGDVQLNDRHSTSDIEPGSFAEIVKECTAFLAANRADIRAGFIRNPRDPEVTAEWRAGTDYWFTRNGHGIGFWEQGRWRPNPGNRLDAAAKKDGGQDLYVGDDGKVYTFPA